MENNNNNNNNNNNGTIARVHAGDCLACGKEMFYEWKHLGMDADNIYKGVSGSMAAHYGSCHDTAVMEFIVCDNCISSALEVGAVHITERRL